MRQEERSKQEKLPKQQELLKVEHFSISFTQYEKGFSQVRLPAVRDLNLTVHTGELVAVVGASGSGKSLLAHGILGLLPYNAHAQGILRYKGEVLTSEQQAALRGKEIVLVPQSVSYLDPLMKVGKQICNGRREKEHEEKMRELLDRYGLGQETAEQYPFQLSGGMIRRVLISTAVIERPALIIADEPTPGLHLAAAARVLGHFREMADEGAGVLLITHDLELAARTADRIVVFYAGTTVEEAAAKDFSSEETLRHPYSRALWRAMPKNGFQSTSGCEPYVKNLPCGCPFAPRCQERQEACGGEIPWRNLRGGYVRCIAAGKEADR